MKLKKLGLAVLAATALVGLASCDGANTPVDPSGNGNQNTPDTPTPDTPTPDTPEEETPISTNVTERPEGNDVDRAGHYTSKDFLTSTTSLQWNPLTWETSDDSTMLSYMQSTLYDYELNDTNDGYRIVCELAESFPTDVTAKYAGKFGVAAGEKKKAWRVKLNQDATWDNGDKIKADDYIYTMQQMLDQEQMNRRADSFYGGSFVIYNAQNYLFSGQTAYNKLPAKYKSVDEAIADGVVVYFDAWKFWNCQGYLDGEDGNECPHYLAYNDTTVYDDYDPTSTYYLKDGVSGADIYNYFKTGGEYESSYKDLAFYAKYTPETKWDEVGFLKVDEYTIDIVLGQELPEPTSFYIPYLFSSVCLIHKPTFEAAWETQPDGKVVNNYGKKLDYTRSYGPYKMTYFEDGKKIEFSKNENWYGYKEGAMNGLWSHWGQYQTNKIEFDVIEQHSTQLLAFEKGDIDSIGLQADDLSKYGSSKYLVYAPQSYTTKVTFNTDFDSLKAMEEKKGDGKNRVIQTVKEFREALSYAIDREYFAEAFTAAAAPGFGMLNYMYQYFEEDGSTSAYRDSVEAKKALVELNGLEYGEGKEYETLNEAYKAMTGYDVTKAKACLIEAYDVAKAQGLYEDGQYIDIQFNVYANDQIYINMVNYFNTAIQTAAVGTPFEGKITFTMFVDDDYYNTMYEGNAQFIYTTWGGSSYDTYGVLATCYCDDSTGGGNQMEIGFDTANVDVDIKIDGTTHTFSLQAWAWYMNNEEKFGADEVIKALGKFNELDVDTKNLIFSRCELAYLQSYVTIPVYYRQTAALYSKKVNYGSTKYIDLIGFGGIRHTTYNFTDEQWAEFAQNSENLKY